MDPLVGRVLGPYELQARLGAGGMGTVYRAVHRRLRQPRAVKVLPHNLAADQTFVQRFEREARLAAELRHPNIVVVHDVDDAGGTYYIAMELLEGRSLRDLIRDEAPVPLDRALGLLEQLARALDFAHGRGVVHRDIKPANVFVGAGDHVTLVDFGIARAADGTVLTGSGVMGTPEYMAPEMLRGEAAEQSADLYALGIVAFEVLTGRLPFVGANTPAIMYAQVHTPPPPLRTVKPDLPEALEVVIARQLAKQPSERYSSAGAFVAALRQAAGSRQQTVIDLDSAILDGVAATLAVGDWHRALQDFERLSDPFSSRAAVLRHRAEMLRAQTEEPPRTPGTTPLAGQAVPRLPTPPSALPMPIPDGDGSGPAPRRAQEQRRRLLLRVAGGVGAAIVLLGGLWLGTLLRPGGDSGPGATNATPDATATQAAEETRTAVIAANVASRISTAAASPPPTAAPSAAPGGGAAIGGAQTTTKQYASPPSMRLEPRKTYSATIKTSLGDMTADLFGDAPNTVNNFVFLAREGFYNGVIFHRVIKDFIVQTGDPTGTGTGGPGYTFPVELPRILRYTRGHLLMANAGPSTQGSQFFICQGDRVITLPMSYSVIGHLTDGYDTLDKIAGVQVRAAPSGEVSLPVDPPRVDSIEIREADIVRN